MAFHLQEGEHGLRSGLLVGLRQMADKDWHDTSTVLERLAVPGRGESHEHAKRSQLAPHLKIQYAEKRRAKVVQADCGTTVVSGEYKQSREAEGSSCER